MSSVSESVSMICPHKDRSMRADTAHSHSTVSDVQVSCNTARSEQQNVCVCESVFVCVMYIYLHIIFVQLLAEAK